MTLNRVLEMNLKLSLIAIDDTLNTQYGVIATDAHEIIGTLYYSTNLQCFLTDHHHSVGSL